MQKSSNVQNNAPDILKVPTLHPVETVASVYLLLLCFFILCSELRSILVIENSDRSPAISGNYRKRNVSVNTYLPVVEVIRVSCNYHHHPGMHAKRVAAACIMMVHLPIVHTHVGKTKKAKRCGEHI